MTDTQQISPKHNSAKEHEGNCATCTAWVDLEGTVLSEIDRTEKDKYNMISYVES